MKKQEQLMISEPMESLDAIESALLFLLDHPEQVEVIDNCTLRPMQKILTQDGEAAKVEYSFAVTYDKAGCEAAPIVEPARVLIEA